MKSSVILIILNMLILIVVVVVGAIWNCTILGGVMTLGRFSRASMFLVTIPNSYA